MSEPVSKRAKIEDASGELSESIKAILKNIDDIQSQLDNLSEKASEEIIKVEQKYNQLRRPHMEKRSKLIKDLPNFWSTVFLNHPQIANLINEEEEKALESLTSVEVEESDDIKSGYKIIFKFKENEYFENDIISKEYFLGGDEPSCKVSAVKWKPGKELGKHVDEDSDELGLTFFQWLRAELEPGVDDIAEVIKDDVWPNPLQYFLVSEIEDLDGDGDEEDDDDDLEEVDDDAGFEDP